MVVYDTSRKKHVASVLFCGLVFLLSACGTTIQSASPASTVVAAMKPGDYHQNLRVGEQNRTYTVHLPPTISNTAALPLLVVLHERGGNAASIARSTHMNAKADQEGFIALYPEAIMHVSNTKQLTWNCCGPAGKKSTGIDDVGFIHLLIEHIQNTYRIDSQRIYATGMADGGSMAYRLACDLSSTFAAIAPVAANFTYAQCQPTQAVSVVHIDSIVHQEVTRSVPYAVSFWIQQNQCATAAQWERNGNTTKVTYTRGQNGTEVVLYSITSSFYTWPTSATGLLWNFFVAHPKMT